jgi:hypothetical protein
VAESCTPVPRHHPFAPMPYPKDINASVISVARFALLVHWFQFESSEMLGKDSPRLLNTLRRGNQHMQIRQRLNLVAPQPPLQRKWAHRESRRAHRGENTCHF